MKRLPIFRGFSGWDTAALLFVLAGALAWNIWSVVDVAHKLKSAARFPSSSVSLDHLTQIPPFDQGNPGSKHSYAELGFVLCPIAVPETLQFTADSVATGATAINNMAPLTCRFILENGTRTPETCQTQSVADWIPEVEGLPSSFVRRLRTCVQLRMPDASLKNPDNENTDSAEGPSLFEVSGLARSAFRVIPYLKAMLEFVGGIWADLV